MTKGKSLTIIIPAYNASKTIGETLRSIYMPKIHLSNKWGLEVIVVDDGSSDSNDLKEVIKYFPEVKLLSHKRNRGMNAARNTGIQSSKGDIVVILDADDQFVPDWPDIFEQVVNEWPEDCNVCYSACRNPDGKITVGEPEYMGRLTFDDILNERHSGEYLPMFRGCYIRNRGYVDLNMRKSCGVVSYLTMSQDAPFWVTPRILRIYNNRQTGSVTSAWASPLKARETALCYKVLFDRFGYYYQTRAPKIYRTKLLRYSVYLKLAHEKGAWRVWAKAIHWSCPLESIAVLMILIFGGSFCSWFVNLAKQLGVIRRYG
ncbi:MAG: glycosyltransferase family 2 protein [Nitrospirota bacterium]